MKPLISVVIASHNERARDLRQCVESIHHSDGGYYAEIIVVDDASPQPMLAPGFNSRLIRNPSRLGVGQSRHVGIEAAHADLVFLADAHCLFDPGWLKPTLDALDGNPLTLVCGQMVALRADATGLDGVVARYWGARMVVEDPEAELRWRILSAKWAPERPGVVTPLSAVCGACYGFNRDFFLKFGGSRMLTEWGGDEENLSLKTLRAGGNIILLKTVRVGHKFRDAAKPMPYRLTIEHCLLNTMVLAHTILPPAEARRLCALLCPGVEAMRARELFRQRECQVYAERDRLEPLWRRSWPECLELIRAIDG